MIDKLDADALAGRYNFEYGAQRPFVLMSPQARAHLILPDGTVTGRYPKVLLHEASAKPLLEYICQNKNWTESTLHSINWEAHTNAINRTSLPHTHIVKLLHRMCASINEDYPHILRCEHAARTTWRNDFLLTRLRDFFIKSNTSPLLSSLMMDGV